MEIKKIFKIGLFIFLTSLFFSACAEKSIETNAQKSKVKSINDILNDTFEYDENKKLYKTKFDINKSNEADNLVFKFENFCSKQKGQLIYTNYPINQDFTKRYSSNIINVCEANDEAYFFIQQMKDSAYIYYQVSIDEQLKNTYLANKKSKQIEPEVSNKDSLKERQEIQKREAAREQKTRSFLSKKDEKTMTFFDSWRYTGSEASCSKRCTDMNLKNNGFKTLKEALNNNWQLVSKIEETEEAIDDYCTCSGASLLVKKK